MRTGVQMITLLMTICMISHPLSCHDKKETFMHQGLSVFACAMGAPKIMADPKRQHLRDGEYVQRWRCQSTSMIATRI